MSKATTPTELNDVLADIFRRLQNLETGADPSLSVTAATSAGSVTLAANAKATVTSTLSWTDADETVNPGGEFHPIVFIDTDNNGAFLYPTGGSLTSAQKALGLQVFNDGLYVNNNTNENRAHMVLQNLDASDHTYYIYTLWVYQTGGSSSS